MQAILNEPFFGFLLSFLAFKLALFLYEKTKIALFNPLFTSIILIIAFLLCFHIKLDYYNKGGNIISLLLFPATVILAVPLYKQTETLKKHAFSIFAGITAGCISGIISVFLLLKLFGLSGSLGVSLIPKSITAPLGLELAKQIGAIPQATVAFIIITGVMGSIIGPWLCNICHIKDKIAVGIALGTSAHAAGTSRALELGEVQGAMSSLAIGLAGLITIFLAPLLLQIL